MSKYNSTLGQSRVNLNANVKSLCRPSMPRTHRHFVSSARSLNTTCQARQDGIASLAKRVASAVSASVIAGSLFIAGPAGAELNKYEYNAGICAF
jgi:hypothetical protein